MSDVGDLRTREVLWERLLNILRRHVHANDAQRTDDGFIREVFKRYLHWRDQPLVDPNE